jgi:hypothetical protein
VLVTACVAGLVACTTTTTTTVPPVTGILIRAETLTSERGCGTGPTQLYKYAVLVYSAEPSLVDTDAGTDRKYNVPQPGNVFDCFTDGEFVSLPDTKGNTTFRLEVFAFNEAAYRAASAIIDRGGIASDDAALRNANPTWTTVCMATQQPDVETLATCDPLKPGLGGFGEAPGPTSIELDTGKTFTIAGHPATCANGVADAGADAASDAGGDAEAPESTEDAGDAGEADAAPPVDAGPLTFTQVRVRPRINAAVVGPAEVVTCPTPYRAEVPADPATYQLDVELLDSSGNPIVPGAQTVCTVTSQSGRTSSAACP